jgi:hypothetical protein
LLWRPVVELGQQCLGFGVLGVDLCEQFVDLRLIPVKQFV